jgi:FkbM family methyltransferase
MKKSYDYYGWKVNSKDVMYHRLLKENRNITLEDIDPMRTVIKKYIPTLRTALDVGCHYGFFTKFLASTFDHVHTFDFNNVIQHFMKVNMRKFNVNNLTIHQYGLGHKNEKVATNDNFISWGRVIPYGPLGTHIDPDGDDKRYVIKRLDSLGIKDVDLIMIDTEGYELNVLRGAKKTIQKYKPVLVVEFHNRNLVMKFRYTLSTLEEYLERLGYKFVENLNLVDKVFVHKSYKRK